MTDAPTKRLGPRTKIYGLSFIGGVLHFLGWAGFGIWPLARVCIVRLCAARELGLAAGWRPSLAVGRL